MRACGALRQRVCVLARSVAATVERRALTGKAHGLRALARWAAAESAAESAAGVAATQTTWLAEWRAAARERRLARSVAEERQRLAARASQRAPKGQTGDSGVVPAVEDGNAVLPAAAIHYRSLRWKAG